MDLETYLLLVLLFIAVFMVIGYSILVVAFHAYERRRKLMESRSLHRWDHGSPDGFGRG
jgi:hypothetical protein